MKFIVYSAVTSDYDLIFNPIIMPNNIQYVLFSDTPKRVKGWQVKPIFKKSNQESSLVNRWHKIFPYELFLENDYSVYIDGNIRILNDLNPLMLEFKESGAALGLFKHNARDDIYQEAIACVDLGKFDGMELSRAREQILVYFKEGLPYDQQLTENGIIFFWHRHPAIKEAMSLWWQQLLLYTKRDQISLPYVIWKTNLDVKIWAWSYKESNPYFEVYSHRGSKLENLKTKIRVHRYDNFIAKMLFRIKMRINLFFSLHIC